MKVLVADNKLSVLKGMKRALEKALPEGSEVITAYDSDDVIDILKENEIRMVFLDIELSKIKGLELARMIYYLDDRINIIFVADNDKYAADAWEMSSLNVCGFIRKPLTVEKVTDVMKNLKHPIHDLYIKCFGNFEVFYKGEPFSLGGENARKILAYLVHLYGSSCTMGELAVAVWENKIDEGNLGNQLRTHISRLKKALSAIGMEGIIVKNEYNRIMIDTKMFDCDYYDYLAGAERAKILAKQGYMKEYSWSVDFNESIST